MTLARRQRQSLCDLLIEVGPFAPTACQGWQAQDLAAHLWVREHRPSALPGIGIKRFADHTARVQTSELHRRGFEQLVADLRRPAGAMVVLDAVANAAEFSIHLLDVARANGREPGISAADEEKLWGHATMFARLAARKFDGRLVVRSELGPEKSLGRGSRIVHVEGKPSELLFYFSGRTAYADVRVTGEPEAVEALVTSCAGL